MRSSTRGAWHGLRGDGDAPLVYKELGQQQSNIDDTNASRHENEHHACPAKAPPASKVFQKDGQPDTDDGPHEDQHREEDWYLEERVEVVCVTHVCCC